MALGLRMKGSEVNDSGFAAWIGATKMRKKDAEENDHQSVITRAESVASKNNFCGLTCGFG